MSERCLRRSGKVDRLCYLNLTPLCVADRRQTRSPLGEIGPCQDAPESRAGRHSEPQGVLSEGVDSGSAAGLRPGEEQYPSRVAILGVINSSGPSAARSTGSVLPSVEVVWFLPHTEWRQIVK